MKGWAVWLTGLPGSGKSTLARLVARKLREKKVPVQILSSDRLRKILTPKPTYTEKERKMVYNVLVFMAKQLTEGGTNIIIDATGNRRSYRDKARREIKKFMEVYLKCPLPTCIRREESRGKTFGAPKKIYEKAFKNLSGTIPGMGAPYEEPHKPEVIVETDAVSPRQAAEKILKALAGRFGVQAGKRRNVSRRGGTT
ncbi:adenylyl-sulfate kinase [Candidatus Hecatella orcuttiae]|jgi:adenylylsulfate kinase|uniref:adenylyl-sulfate kinase n=1 Tax=Candidatus Hecatella orcuttiae TaxID=1935119 RepID=UPI0028681A94|nr:adenylyl-sulfate kinase [Candidatus Hecatella orcuttiae]